MTESQVHISVIRVGDTIMHEGEMRTVCKNNMGSGDLLGMSLFGDSYHSGHKKVTRVNFNNNN